MLTENDILDAVRSFEGPLLLDLDETLYLRNSSRDFIASAKPRLFAIYIMRVTNKLRLWRFTGESTADLWRIVILTIFMPWIWWTWREKGTTLGRAHANSALVAAANGGDREVWIATFGIKTVVKPIVAGLGLHSARLISCRLWHFSDRRNGKLQLVQKSMPFEQISQALVLTDSNDDRDLLEVCAVPILKTWSVNSHVDRNEVVIWPLEYLSKIKRPGRKNVSRIFRQDFSIWVIASIFEIYHNPIFIFSLICLFFSFWSVYELGYYDNDVIAGREVDGLRSESYLRERLIYLPYIFYANAVFFSVVGLLSTVWTYRLVVQWSICLISLGVIFAIFNRIDKSSRVWMYLLLQLMRTMGAAFILEYTNSVIILAISYAVAHWISYLTYREVKRGENYAWPSLKTLAMWFFLFVVMSLAFFTETGLPKGGLAVQWILGLVLVTYEARGELRTIFKGIRWI